MKKYFYETTGMYIDWDQLKKLPEINTLIDIGVGDLGTPDLYQRFPKSKLILVDPLDEAEQYAKTNLTNRDYIFHKYAVGNIEEERIINIEERTGRSTLLNVTELNYEGDPVDKKQVKIKTLDSLVEVKSLGKIGIKIDTEGFELDVIKGATKTLTKSEFVLAEVRHNHQSFDEQYKLHEFVDLMYKNKFSLTMILTAKPLIADLCFERNTK